jgi:hypothetical protein
MLGAATNDEAPAAELIIGVGCSSSTFGCFGGFEGVRNLFIMGQLLQLVR